MNIKRLVGFSVLIWIAIFVVYSIIMFMPWFKGNDLRIHVGFYVLLLPLTLAWAKLYFREDPPTWKKGLYLGLAALLIGTVLDLIITVPFFVKSYTVYYGNWLLYVGFLEMIVITTLAGGEFDGTYSKNIN